MKLSAITIVSILSSFAAAEDDATLSGALSTAGVPKCAIPCITKAYKQISCAPNDFKCQCSAAAQDAVTKCLVGSPDGTCGTTELLQAKTAGEKVCTDNGVTPGGASGPATSSLASAKPSVTNPPKPSGAQNKDASSSSAKGSSAFAAATQVPTVGLFGLVGVAAVFAL